MNNDLSLVPNTIFAVDDVLQYIMNGGTFRYASKGETRNDMIVVDRDTMVNGRRIRDFTLRIT